MSDAKQRLEALGHHVAEVEGRFYVRDPRGFEQGPWDQSQLDGWANAVTGQEPQLEEVDGDQLEVSRETSGKHKRRRAAAREPE